MAMMMVVVVVTDETVMLRLHGCSQFRREASFVVVKSLAKTQETAQQKVEQRTPSIQPLDQSQIRLLMPMTRQL